VCWNSNLWAVVEAMSDEERRRLLQFVTGSDRVPVGGLRLVVARAGGDSAQLPTAQTCFNVLLLPDYASRDKLRERLLTALRFCHGFGIL